MMKLVQLCCMALLMVCIMACSSTRRATYKSDGHLKNLSMATDKSYGYTESNPVRVGGGAANQHRYLGMLAGPKGEPIVYQRLGSCCMFKTKNGLFGDSGLLDKYELKWQGGDEAVILYLNFYDYEQPMCPIGLTLK